MSGFSALPALVAARASSVAVTVGSAIDRSGLPSLGRLPALDLARAEAIRARAVAPAALASEVRLRLVRRLLPAPAAVDAAVLRLAERRLLLPALLPSAADEAPLALLLPALPG